MFTLAMQHAPTMPHHTTPHHNHRGGDHTILSGGGAWQALIIYVRVSDTYLICANSFRSHLGSKTAMDVASRVFHVRVRLQQPKGNNPAIYEAIEVTPTTTVGNVRELIEERSNYTAPDLGLGASTWYLQHKVGVSDNCELRDFNQTLADCEVTSKSILLVRQKTKRGGRGLQSRHVAEMVYKKARDQPEKRQCLREVMKKLFLPPPLHSPEREGDSLYMTANHLQYLELLSNRLPEDSGLLTIEPGPSQSISDAPVEKPVRGASSEAAASSGLGPARRSRSPRRSCSGSSSRPTTRAARPRSSSQKRMLELKETPRPEPEPPDSSASLRPMTFVASSSAATDAVEEEKTEGVGFGFAGSQIVLTPTELNEIYGKGFDLVSCLGWEHGAALGTPKSAVDGHMTTPLPANVLQVKKMRRAIGWNLRDRGDDEKAKAWEPSPLSEHSVAPYSCSKCHKATWPAYVQKRHWKKSGAWNPGGWVCVDCAQIVPTCTLCDAQTWNSDTLKTFFLNSHVLPIHNIQTIIPRIQ